MTQPYLKTLQLKNFKSFAGEHRIENIPTGLIYVQAHNKDEGFNSNGGGKSSLLGSLAWVLYGQTSNGVSKDDLITHGEGEASVVVFCENLMVQRTKPRGKSETLTFWTPATGQVCRDLTQTQTLLEQEVKLPRRIFWTSSWIDREAGAMHLLLAKPAERLRILQEVFREERYKFLSQSAATRRKTAEREVELHEQKMAVLKGRMEDLRTRIGGLEQQKHVEESRNLKEWEDQKETLRTRIIVLQNEISALEEEERVLSRDFPVSSRPEKLLTYLGSLQAERRRLETAIHSPAMAMQGEVCPTCKQVVRSPGFFKADVEETRNKLSKVLAEEIRTQSILDKARGMEHRIMAIGSQLMSQRGLLGQVEHELKELEETCPILATLALLEDLLTQARGELSTLGAQLCDARIVAPGIRQSVDVWSEWEKGFGPRGIPNMLLDRMRQGIQFYCKQYLRQLSGLKYGVEFPLSDVGFEINLHTNQGVTNIMALSGGERWRVNLALILAFRKTLEQMYPSGLGFAVLDDVYSALDEEGEGRVQDLAEMLAMEVPHVFIAVPHHSGILKGSVIRIEKAEGRSRIIQVKAS